MPRAKYLFDNWDAIENKMAGRLLYLFLDYDGTLAPIAATPDKAVMPRSVRLALKKLSADPSCRLAIISGRSVRDVSGRVGIKGIVYAGNHGLEIKGSNGRIINHVPPMYGPIFRRIKTTLGALVIRYKGAVLEDKGCSISVHYRMVGRDGAQKLRSEIRRALMHDKQNGNIIVRRGKMVIEILPMVYWDKGKVVLSILKGYKDALPVYVGDDVTDEDAFKVIGKDGIAVIVGEHKKTRARYRLKDVSDVEKFMRYILNICEKGKRWLTKN